MVTFSIWFASDFLPKVNWEWKPPTNGKETIKWFLFNNLMVYFQQESKPVLGGLCVAIHT